MRSWRRWRGQHGEQMAVQFLQRQGYRILHQNYRCRGGEVDIVAWDGPTLVFIEVKTKGQDALWCATGHGGCAQAEENCACCHGLCPATPVTGRQYPF